MRTRSRRLALVVPASVLGLALGLLDPTPATASTFVQPARSPVVVPVRGARGTAAQTVVVSGFAEKALVYVEQCDGVASTAQGWSPTANCDLGSSPAPVIADARGTVTFSAADRNHAFRPFAGESPQSIFNCLAATQRAPANGLPSFTNCKLRVSTSNMLVTADQAFVALELTVANASAATASAAATPTTVPPGKAKAPATARASGPAATRARSAAEVAAASGNVSSSCRTDCANVATLAGPSSDGLLALSNSDLLLGYVFVIVGLSAAAATIVVRRRRRLRAG